MGGEVGVDSGLGKGSAFWFTVRLGKALPLAVKAEALPPLAAEAVLRRDYRSSKELLVEDDSMNQVVACLLLKEAGLHVAVAVAVKLVKRNDYAVILMDMQMPVMDGIEAAGMIRPLPGQEDVPILALTANAFSEKRARCLAAGMNDVIAKPFIPDTLYNALLKVLMARTVTVATVRDAGQAVTAPVATAQAEPA